MKNIYVAILGVFISSLGFSQVIISQYYEGSSNNKWIELTNVGVSSVDLTSPQQYLALFTNASADNPDSSSPNNTETLSGSIAPGASILFKNSSSVLPAYASGSNSSTCNFNGDDLLILTTATGASAWANRTDVIGNGTSWGTNTSFYRNSSVSSPSTTFNTADWTEVTNATVDNASTGTSERLGEHIFSGGSPSTSVDFTFADDFAFETDGTYDIQLSITNPDGTNATTVDVVLISGDAAFIDNYTTQTVNFAAGSSADEFLTINITDNGSFDGNQTLTFELQMPGGGNNASVGSQSTFELTIEDDEPDPSVVIAFQSFGTDGGNWPFILNPAAFNSGGDVWDVVEKSSFHTFSTIPEEGQDFFFGIQDLDSPSGAPDFGTIRFESPSLSGFSDMVLSFKYEVDGFDGTDDMKYELFENGVSTGEVVFVDGQTGGIDQDGTITINITPGTFFVTLVVSVRQDGGSDFGALDDFRLTGIYNGLAYSGGSWTPNAPSPSTGSDNAVILDGVATISSDASIQSMTVYPGAGLIVDNGVTLTGLTLDLESNSSSYSSLIVDGSLAGNINNNVTYRRYVNPFVGVGGNDLVTSPLTLLDFGTFIEDFENMFTPGDFNDTVIYDDGGFPVVEFAFGPFDNTIPAYVNFFIDSDFPGDSDDYFTLIDPTKGYRVASDFATTVAFRGGVNTGPLTSTGFSAPGIDPLDKWNLMGNPYPSYLNAQDFLFADVDSGTPGIQANIDKIDGTFSAIYGYNDSTGSSPTGIWTVINNFQNNTVNIAPGQGFFVPSNNTGELTYTPDMRTTVGTDDFILGMDPIPDPSHLRINLSNSDSTFGTDFYFSPLTDSGLNPGYDAGLFGGNAPEFSLYSELLEGNQGIPMAIQALGETAYNDVVIPLGVNAAQGAQITVSIGENTLPGSVNIYLEDNVNNTNTLLNSGDFVLTPSSDLNGTGRFFLRLSNSALSTTDFEDSTLRIFTDIKERTIVISGELNAATAASVFDLQGRLVKQMALDTSLRTQVISTTGLSSGVYVVQLSNSTQSKTEKVILH